MKFKRFLLLGLLPLLSSCFSGNLFGDKKIKEERFFEILEKNEAKDNPYSHAKATASFLAKKDNVVTKDEKDIESFSYADYDKLWFSTSYHHNPDLESVFSTINFNSKEAKKLIDYNPSYQYTFYSALNKTYKMKIVFKSSTTEEKIDLSATYEWDNYGNIISCSSKEKIEYPNEPIWQLASELSISYTK